MDVKVGDKVSVRWDETGARFDATVEAIHADGPSLVFDVCYVEKVQGKRCYEPRVVADRVLPLGSPSPATKRQRGAPPRYTDEDDVLVIDSRGGGEEDGEKADHGPWIPIVIPRYPYPFVVVPLKNVDCAACVALTRRYSALNVEANAPPPQLKQSETSASNLSIAYGATLPATGSYGPPYRNRVRFVCSLAAATGTVEIVDPLGMRRDVSV
jgi:hypothetical protein